MWGERVIFIRTEEGTKHSQIDGGIFHFQAAGDIKEYILDSEMKEWMLWMKTIFMPLNDIREKVIIEKAHLIVEEQMPQCLLDFVTHVVGYKAVLSKWAEDDYSERRSTIGWPPEFDAYVRRSYQALKTEQTRLLHNALWRAWHKFTHRSRPTPA